MFLTLILSLVFFLLSSAIQLNWIVINVVVLVNFDCNIFILLTKTSITDEY